MTKKHFEAIAKILSKHSVSSPAAGFDEGYETAREGLAIELADLFEMENPRFDRDVFLLACGVVA